MSLYILQMLALRHGILKPLPAAMLQILIEAELHELLLEQLPRVHEQFNVITILRLQ